MYITHGKAAFSIPGVSATAAPPLSVLPVHQSHDFQLIRRLPQHVFVYGAIDDILITINNILYVIDTIIRRTRYYFYQVPGIC